MQSSVLICQCGQAELIDPAKLLALAASLKAAGIAFTAVPDLCGLAAVV